MFLPPPSGLMGEALFVTIGRAARIGAISTTSVTSPFRIDDPNLSRNLMAKVKAPKKGTGANLGFEAKLWAAAGCTESHDFLYIGDLSVDPETGKASIDLKKGIAKVAACIIKHVSCKQREPLAITLIDQVGVTARLAELSK